MGRRTLVIDLKGNLAGKSEESGTRLRDDLRLHELNAALIAINDALEFKGESAHKVKGLFTQALAEFIAKADESNATVASLSVELSKTKEDKIRVVFELLSTAPDLQTCK